MVCGLFKCTEFDFVFGRMRYYKYGFSNWRYNCLMSRVVEQVPCKRNRCDELIAREGTLKFSLVTKLSLVDKLNEVKWVLERRGVGGSCGEGGGGGGGGGRGRKRMRILDWILPLSRIARSNPLTVIMAPAADLLGVLTIISLCSIVFLGERLFFRRLHIDT